MTLPTELGGLRLPSFRLDGRTALVTGASGGLGAGIAVGLAEAGAHLVLVGRREAPLQEVAQAVRDVGGSCTVVPLDVTDTQALRNCIAGLPRLDVLVNNAGTNVPEPLVEVSEEHLDRMLDLNVRAVFIASQAAVKKMLEHEQRAELGAAIVNISSQMGHVGSPQRTVYCMTKHALEGLTKAMAVELAPQQIRVNSVGPTFTDTPLVRRIVDTAEKRDYLFSRIPLGRLCTLQDIMAAVVYLASPAAAMVTGTHLIVDGGWTAQ